MTTPAPDSIAHVVTDRAARYGKQLASHLGRRSGGEWDDSDGTGHILLGDEGARAELVARPYALLIEVRVPAGADVARLEDVLGRHLVRFGRGDLAVAWVRADGSAGTAQIYAPD